MARAQEASMNTTRNEAGFSLIELLVAVLVTMLISGAIFGLLNAGQGAFRREPELTDRQQNIRLAMDLIQRDLAMAGSSMDPFEQAFSRGDGPNETGTLLDNAGWTPPAGPLPSGQPASDVLEVMGAATTCNEVPVLAGGGGVVTTAFGIPDCFPVGVSMAAISGLSGGNDTAFWGLSGPNAANQVLFGNQPSKSDIALKGFPTGITAGVTKVVPIQLARYAIAPDAAGVPSLWRSGRGGLNDAAARTPPGDATGQWQLIARGIEDLQVRYRTNSKGPFPADPAQYGSPEVAAPGNFDNIVQEVEVTLWARTVAPNLQGQTTQAGVNAIHGSLRTVTSPRAALMALTLATPPRWK